MKAQHSELAYRYRKRHQTYISKNSVAYFSSAYNYSVDTPDQDIIDFHTTIIMQDKPIVESQRPELVPMDMGKEALIKTDIPITRYRRYLQNIGMRWGVA